MHETHFRGAHLLLAFLLAFLLALPLACTDGQTYSGPGEASIEGAPFGQDFSASHAAYRLVGAGAASMVVIRIAPRPDVCQALVDPADDVSPSLVFTVNGTQVQNYQIVPLDYAGPPGGGAPPPTATLLLQTFGGGCDAGAEDAGSACATSYAAHSGSLTLDALGDAEGQDAKGAFAAEFADGGSVSGSFRATWCTAIR